MSGKKGKQLLKLGVLILCVVVVWAAAIGTANARSYGADTEVVSGRSDGLVISYYDNTVGMNVSLGSANQLISFNGILEGVPEQPAQAGGMFMNINAQMMLAMAQMAGQAEAVENLLENYLGITDASVCYATSLEIEIAQPCRVITFTNTTDQPAELNFDYNFMVLNDADVRVSETTSAAVTPGADVPLDDMLQQFVVDQDSGKTAYEMGLTAAILMNDPNYAMTQKTMAGHVQTLLQPNASYDLTIEFPAEDLCMVQAQISDAYLTQMLWKTVAFQPAAYDYVVEGLIIDSETGLPAADPDTGAYITGTTTVSANGSALEAVIDCVNGTQITFDAAANAGKKLGYWLDANGVYTSEDAEASVALFYGRDSMQPAFVSSGATRNLETGGVLYYGWSDAMNAAGYDGIVTLITAGETNIASLSENVFSNVYNTASVFTVPANVKFVVPHTPEELAPGYWYYSSHATDVTQDSQSGVSQPYCKLRVPEGYSLNVASGGTLLVNGMMTVRSATQGEIATGFGMIELDGNMTVNGELLVRGYIAQREYASRTSDNEAAHKGHISVPAGGEVNIVFQIMDFRGGTATFATFNACMPISMYSFDNVMVKADYAEGSTLSAYCVVGMQGMAARTTVPILSTAEGSMFNMGVGSAVSTDYLYDGDRFVVNADAGDLSLNYININLYGTGNSAIGLTTASYQLPLHDGMVVNVKDGATVTIDYAVKLLPGAEVNVENGGRVNLNNRLFLFGLADYKPAYSLNAAHFRLRTDCVLVEEGGTAVRPTSDPSLNVAGELVIGYSSANDMSSGKIYQSVNMETGIHAGAGAVFVIPEYLNLTDDGNMYTIELEGTSSSAVWTDIDPENNDLAVWTEVKGLFGGMSNRIEDEQNTGVDERYIPFLHEDLAPYDEGYIFGADEQDGEVYWYRYRIDFVDADGNAVDSHLVAPAYDELMIGDLTYDGVGHVIKSIAITDSEGCAIPANDDSGTNMTYTGYVDENYETASDNGTTMTDFSEYDAWQGVKLDNLNLAANENGDPVVDFVVTLSLQEAGWLVNWTQTGSGSSSEITTWHSFTDPTGRVEYARSGEFSVQSYEITQSGTTVPGATLSARLEDGNTVLILEGVDFAGVTDSVDVSMVTASEFVHATLHYPDNSTTDERMPVVGGTNALIVSIPQPADGWYIAESVTAEGYTVENNFETVTLSWDGEAPSTSKVDIYLAPYDYKLVYDVTNISDSAELTFTPVYTNDPSYTQTSNRVMAPANGYKYYFVVDGGQSLELTTATTPGTTLYNVEATMGSYHYQVQFYDEDTLLKNEFLYAGQGTGYSFDEHTAFDGEVSAIGSGSFENASHNAYLNPDGTLSAAQLAVNNVLCDVTLTVNTKAFDYIVTFFDQNADQLSMEYVADGGQAAYAVADGKFITACSDASALNNDGFTALTNTVSDGWGSVAVTDVTENKAVNLTISDYVTKVVWLQQEGDTILQTTAKYYTEAVSTDTMTPLTGYVFLSEGYSLGTSNGAAGTIGWTLGEFTLNITGQGDFEVTLPMGAYASRVQFVNRETSEVEKIVYVNAAGYDMSSSRSVIPYFQYSASAKKMLVNVTLTSGTAALTEADTMKFDGLEQDAWRMVEVTDITSEEVVVTFTPKAYSRILAVSYTDPWGTETETVYTSGDSYTGSVSGHNIIGVECEDAADVSFTALSFTVNGIPDAVDSMGLPAAVPVYVEWKLVEERLFTDLSQFTNATNSTAGIVVTDSAYGVFTVTCAKACVVAIDNGDGTYTRLTAMPTAEATTYEFACPANFDTSIKLMVAVKGDVSGDGQINNLDSNQVKAASLQKLNLVGVKKLAADVNGDGNINNLDSNQIKAASLAKLSFKW